MTAEIYLPLLWTVVVYTSATISQWHSELGVQHKYSLSEKYSIEL